MIEMEDFDADGFKLEFESSVGADEREFYIQTYPNVDMVLDANLHCTSCHKHIGAAPCNANAIRMHPILQTTQCKKCYAFYHSGKFDKGEDGSELYCRWCGQGGEVFCCANCEFVFCSSCISKNMPSGLIPEIESNDNWECFRCQSKCMWSLRARHWAMVNYLEKRKCNIIRKHEHNDDRIYELMNLDLSTCCNAKAQQRRANSNSTKRKRNNLSESDDNCSKNGENSSKKSKKPDESLELTDSADSAENTTDDAFEVIDSSEDTAVAAAATNEIPTGDIVCTPDIMSMFSAPLSEDDPNDASAKAPSKPVKRRKLATKPAQTAKLPIAVPTSSSSHLIETDRQVVTVATPKSAPVYHTINGYTIDLSSAARQDTFRLPNGKLIQVKRQPNAVVGPKPNAVTTSKTTTTSSKTPSTSKSVTYTLQVRPPRPITPQISTPAANSRPPTNLPMGYQVVQPAAMATTGQPAQIRHIGFAAQPISVLPQHQNLNALHLQQQQQLLNSLQQVPQTTIVQQHTQPPVLATAYPPAARSAPPQQPSQAASLSAQEMARIQLPQQQPTSVRTKTSFPNHPVGRSRAAFEEQIFAAQDLCQHIIAKLNSLMKSNAYKTACCFAEVKDLHIHLSYLYTYTMDRVRALQEKSQANIKLLEKATTAANTAADKRAKYVNDEDDLKIVEQPQTCIEIVSDDDADDNDECEVSEVTVPSAAPTTRPIAAAATTVTPTVNLPIIISSVRSESSAETCVRSIQVISDARNKQPSPTDNSRETTPIAAPTVQPFNIGNDLKLQRRPQVVIRRIESSQQDDNELPLPPNIRNDPKPLALPPTPIASLVANRPFDIGDDKKLRSRPKVVIQRIKNFIQTKPELKPLQEPSQAQDATLKTKSNDRETVITADELVELIEVDDEEDYTEETYKLLEVVDLDDKNEPIPAMDGEPMDRIKITSVMSLNVDSLAGPVSDAMASAPAATDVDVTPPPIDTVRQEGNEEATMDAVATPDTTDDAAATCDDPVEIPTSKQADQTLDSLPINASKTAFQDTASHVVGDKKISSDDRSPDETQMDVPSSSTVKIVNTMSIDDQDESIVGKTLNTVDVITVEDDSVVKETISSGVDATSPEPDATATDETQMNVADEETEIEEPSWSPVEIVDTISIEDQDKSIVENTLKTVDVITAADDGDATLPEPAATAKDPDAPLEGKTSPHQTTAAATTTVTTTTTAIKTPSTSDVLNDDISKVQPKKSCEIH